MEPAAAAAEYWATLDDVAAAAAVNRRHDRASKVLKDHMAGANILIYKGISMVTLAAGTRLNMALLESRLQDPALVESCREPATRRTLVPKRRPKLSPAGVSARATHCIRDAGAPCPPASVPSWGTPQPDVQSATPPTSE